MRSSFQNWPRAHSASPAPFHDVSIEPQARQSLIRRLYLNTRCGTVFGQHNGQVLRVQTFADDRAHWTDVDEQTNWNGHWKSMDDTTWIHDSPGNESALAMTASWNRTGTLVIRAHTAQGEAPVHILA